ncbi:MAG: hypothetical protein KO206_06370 [Methanomicrobiaceae archaeon]|uniref:Uncharacterized protein n=1 Tax=hydrocarbon metagenome TaxID=938273 RepID=A0A0W8FJS0_9ZZZZ|nr:hypothetical protein [Methanomicrobiaceae archaeon]
MPAAVTFQAKPGKEEELEQLPGDPEAGRWAAGLQGAARNTLFFARGRMIRVLEFPDDAEPPSMSDVIQQNPDFERFMRKLGSLIENGFDLDSPGSLEEFSGRITCPLIFDVRP